MATRSVAVLEGDQTGQELLEEALRVLQADVVGFAIDFQRFDLRLEQRRRTKNRIVEEASAAMRRYGLGLKAATITPEAPGDVGSPNAILREAIDATVILRRAAAAGRAPRRRRPRAGVGGTHGRGRRVPGEGVA